MSASGGSRKGDRGARMRLGRPLLAKFWNVGRWVRRAVHPDTGINLWRELMRKEGPRWERALAAAKGGPAVLIATGAGGHAAVSPVESALAVALTLRGADVKVLLCDAALPACLQATREVLPSVASFARRGPSPLCASCFRSGLTSFGSLGIPVLRYSHFLSPDDNAEVETLAGDFLASRIAEYREGSLAVGEHAMAGALRYFAKGTLEDEPLGEAVLRRYLAASLLAVRVAEGVAASGPFTAWVFNHGIYVPQGLMGEVARKHSIPVVTWNPAYRKKCFIFSHGDTYHHTLMHEPTSAWEDLSLTPDLEARLMAYLKSRWQGSEDWIWFHERPRTDSGSIRSSLGIDPARPLIGMLTNVIWDAQLHYPSNAFADMIEWALATIRYFAAKPDLQLVIRVHPAEITGGIPSRQRMADVIKAAFPDLPENVILIPPESRVSTYAVMEMCDSAIIYGTKTGVELASTGIPVIVAGEAWLRNKGISLDVTSSDEYFGILDRLPIDGRLDGGTLRRARTYAYHFFFRRMIPLGFMQPRSGWPPYRLSISTLSELAPGQDAGLDVVCEGILAGKPFIYPDEDLFRQAH